MVIGRGVGCADRDAFERKLFVIRKQIATRFEGGQCRGMMDFYICIAVVAHPGL